MLIALLILIALMALTTGAIMLWSKVLPTLPRLMEVLVALVALVWLFDRLGVWSIR